MSSEISTEKPARDTGIQPWHFYLLLSMAGATWAVMQARDTQPASLLLLSAAVVAAGAVGIAVHYAVLGFMGLALPEHAPLARSAREALETEKALVLRSIKELEFDRAMRKVGDVDFAEIDRRLRARAVSLMAELDRPDPAEPAAPAPPAATPEDRCPSCDVRNDADARFCKSCGQRLHHA